MIRILHLNDHLAAVGGVETYLLGLIPLLEAEGNEVHVGYASGQGGLFRHEKQIPLLASIRFEDIGPCREAVAAWIRETQPDVIHLHGIQNLGAIQAAVASGRAILHGHDYRPICPASNFFFKRSKTICQRTCGPGCFAVTALRHCLTPRPLPALYFYRRVQWILRHAPRIRQVIAPSEAARQRFLQAGFEPGQVTTLPYFCPLPPRDEPRPLPPCPTLTFLGRASYNKGWEVFIAALGLLPHEVQGLMVGNFSETDRRNIVRLAGRAGCAGRLTLEGWAGRDAVVGIIARTTVLIFPSLWPETLGIVGLEALSQGVPVIASDVGGVREWLIEGVTGSLVAPGDAAALAGRVAAWLGDTAKLTRSGGHGLELIRNKFSPSRHLQGLTDIYQSVCATV